MPKYKELRDLKIIYGSITVSDYEGFERKLQEEYTPLITSSYKGKSTTVLY